MLPSASSRLEGAHAVQARVLICEDDGLAALRLERSLAALGYQVIGSARNGREGVELAQRVRPDLVLMDVDLPELSGIGAATEIRRTTQAVVVMLTGHSDERTIREALAAGVSGYLVKPVTNAQLRSSIEVALSARPRVSGPDGRTRGELSAAALAAAAVQEAQSVIDSLRVELLEQRELARRLAESFLRSPPELVGYSISTAYQPAHPWERVGGDFFDFFEPEPGKLGVVLGDVCGHGVEAAAGTAVTRNTLRAYALEEPDPGEAITRLNRALCSYTAEEPILVTLFYAVLDLESGHVAYANAGHPPGFLVAERGKLSELTPTGGMLGVEAAWEWRSAGATLDGTGALILFTDGITEARRGELLFGEERAARCVAHEAKRRDPDFAGALCEEVSAFSSSNLRDDVAVVALRRITETAFRPA